jgi:hypothetical protein
MSTGHQLKLIPFSSFFAYEESPSGYSFALEA